VSATEHASRTGGSGDGEQRAAPQYCPYCGDEDLRPEPTSHRAWHCRACARVFEVSFIGLKLGVEA
jgi:ribosomal protein L37AE/L43A